MRPHPARTLVAGRLAAAVFAASLALACRSGPAPGAVGGAAAAPPTATAAVAAGSEAPMATEGKSPAGEGTPCYRVLPLDERRRKLECGNGDRFTIGRAADGKWYPETKVRAGLVPGYASPEDAGKALCGCS
jgi:hypothetical protein